MTLVKKSGTDFEQSITNFILSHRHQNGKLDFDGIFVNTDLNALSTAHILQKHGYSIPDDVQLIGFDGIPKFGDPNQGLFVSSICQPIPELAKTCVNLVLAKEKKLVPSLTLLPVSFQSGGTTKDKHI